MDQRCRGISKVSFPELRTASLWICEAFFQTHFIGGSWSYFLLKISGILPHVRWNLTRGQIEHQKTWKTWKTFWVFWCSVQSEVKEIISVKTNLCEVRLSHQSDCSILDFLAIPPQYMTQPVTLFLFWYWKEFRVYQIFHNLIAYPGCLKWRR